MIVSLQLMTIMIFERKNNIKNHKRIRSSTYHHVTFTPFSLRRTTNSIFMHDPVGLNTICRLSFIENQSLLKPNFNFILCYLRVSSSSVPKSITSSSFWTFSIWILSFPLSKKVPFIFSIFLVLFY
jgi:hypothetical protein